LAGVTSPGRAQAAKARVVLVRNERLRGRLTAEEQRRIYREMVERGLQRLFGESASAVWRRLFTPQDVIGLKVNCLGGLGMSTNVQFTFAVADSLIAAQIPPQRLIVFDRTNDHLQGAGYDLAWQGQGVQVYGTDTEGVGYEDRSTASGALSTRLSTILTERCTALLNLPVIKDHQYAGLTVSLKNHFGAINNPSKFHGQGCDPAIADLNKLPVIRQKQKLILCDATEVLYEGGPSDHPENHWPYCGLFLSQDPVALDTMAWTLLEQIRQQRGLPSLEAAGRPPRYLATAAEHPYRLGTNDRQAIDFVYEAL